MLVLPHPLKDGEPQRKDHDGTLLHNPNWLVENTLKDLANTKYINAVVKTVIENGIVSKFLVKVVSNTHIETP